MFGCPVMRTRNYFGIKDGRIMMSKWLKKWNNYKYRFVPWIMFNFHNRTARKVPQGAEDKIISNEDVLLTLEELCKRLHHASKTSCENQKHAHHQNHVIKDVLGFSISRGPSTVSGAGAGVLVQEGVVPKGVLVALYPGTVYYPYEPVLLQSIANPFMFRCLDGVLIDGKDHGMSRTIFRSTSGRERIGYYDMCDTTWLRGGNIVNPLAVGQFVNNQNKENPANVAYQEIEIPLTFPVHLMNLIPNINYGPRHEYTTSFVRSVALVSLREIQQGQELFSTYFTVVH